MVLWRTDNPVRPPDRKPRGRHSRRFHGLTDRIVRPPHILPLTAVGASPCVVARGLAQRHEALCWRPRARATARGLVLAPEGSCNGARPCAVAPGLVQRREALCWRPTAPRDDPRPCAVAR